MHPKRLIKEIEALIETWKSRKRDFYKHNEFVEYNMACMIIAELEAAMKEATDEEEEDES